MSDEFGSQTLTFTVVTGTGVYDDWGQEETTETTVDVTGCYHRPLSATEAAELYGDVARQMWRSTCPPVAAVTAAKSTGKFIESGRTFHIFGGPKQFEDFEEPFVVTIDSEFFPQ